MLAQKDLYFNTNAANIAQKCIGQTKSKVMPLIAVRLPRPRAQKLPEADVSSASK